MELLFWIIYVIVALMIGSILTKAAIRLPNNESIASKCSCPKCKHQLSIMDKIPIISYIRLKGNCRYCGSGISLLYPFGEILTLSIFILIPLTFGFSKELIIAYPFSIIMITVTLSDLKYQIIPNKIVYPGIILILILRLFIHPLPLWNYLLSAVIFGGLLLLIAVISRGGMGGGDIKLFFLIGLVLGLQDTLLAFFISSFVGAIIGGGLLLFRKVKAKQLIPFGPFIFIGTIVAYLFGSNIWAWYLAF